MDFTENFTDRKEMILNGFLHVYEESEEVKSSVMGPLGLHSAHVYAVIVYFNNPFTRLSPLGAYCILV